MAESDATKAVEAAKSIIEKIESDDELVSKWRKRFEGVSTDEEKAALITELWTSHDDVRRLSVAEEGPVAAISPTATTLVITSSFAC